MDEEALIAVRTLRLKLRAMKAVIRDLSQWAAEAEHQLERLERDAEPKEAERVHDSPKEDSWFERCVA